MDTAFPTDATAGLWGKGSFLINLLNILLAILCIFYQSDVLISAFKM